MRVSDRLVGSEQQTDRQGASNRQRSREQAEIERPGALLLASADAKEVFVG